MDKNSFFKYFTFCEDEYEIAKLYDLFNLGLRGARVVSKSFYTAGYFNSLKSICEHEGIECVFEGLFNFSERGIICLNGAYSNIIIVKIICLDKFKNPQHKDYLGGIMSIGIEREKIGDLRVVDNCCYLATTEEIASVIKDNVNKVGNMPVKIEICNDNDIPDIQFKNEIIMIPSMRLDSIVSEITHLSRSKSESLVKRGEVLVNYNLIREKSYVIRENDIITIRKYGKYIISDNIGNTKSGKIKLEVKKFT